MLGSVGTGGGEVTPPVDGGVMVGGGVVSGGVVTSPDPDVSGGVVLPPVPVVSVPLPDDVSRGVELPVSVVGKVLLDALLCALRNS
jgi:hypothetical protein